MTVDISDMLDKLDLTGFDVEVISVASPSKENDRQRKTETI